MCGILDTDPLIVSRTGSAIIYPFGREIKVVDIPSNHQEYVLHLYNHDMHKLRAITRLLAQSRGLVSKLSGQLFDLFGAGKEKITKSTGDLVKSLAFDSSSTDELNETAFGIYCTLKDLHSHQTPLRRQELVERVFVDAVRLEVELMGWKDFIRSQHSLLTDERYHEYEQSYEFLFSFKNEKFLVGRCGTGKVVVLPVGRSVKTCAEAQSWLAGDTIRGFPLPKFFSLGRA